MSGSRTSFSGFADWERQVHEISTVQRENQALLSEARAVAVLLERAGIDSDRIGTAPSLTEKGQVIAMERALDALSDGGASCPCDPSELLSAAESARIRTHLRRPLYARSPLDENDLVAAGVSGLMAAAIDVVLGTPGKFVQRAMADKHHWLGRWMKRVHDQAPGGAAIDYQGEGFGGGWHRERSRGHDLLRFWEGILQFRNGVFRGVFYTEDGRRVEVETNQNGKGGEYAPLALVEAAISWALHNAADFFSARSLPIPGSSWLAESPRVGLRRFSERLYQDGIHLRHVSLQAMAPLVAELCVQFYLFLRAGDRSASAEVERKEAELLLLAHAVAAGVHTGKLLLLRAPTMLNVPLLLTLLRRGHAVVRLEAKRRSPVARLVRSIEEFSTAQDALERLLQPRLKPIA